MKKIIGIAGMLLLAGTASADRVDLAVNNTGTLTGAVGGVARFDWADQQTTGTGVIQPFVRLQHNGTEEGYNSSGNLGANWPDVKAGTWTHDLQLGSVPIVGGYYQFLLDINQNKGGENELLSLEAVKIYVGTSGGKTDADLSQLGTLGWSMSAGDDVKLDFTRNPGSGAGDMFMYVPVAALGTNTSSFVYLYSHFGTSYPTNDGFEEWAVVGPAGGVSESVPLPAAAGMGLMGLVGVGSRRRRA